MNTHIKQAIIYFLRIENLVGVNLKKTKTKTKKTVILPVKMDLFGNSQELQYWTTNLQ